MPWILWKYEKGLKLNWHALQNTVNENQKVKNNHEKQIAKKDIPHLCIFFENDTKNVGCAK